MRGQRARIAPQPAQEGLDLGAARPFGGTKHGGDEAALAVEHHDGLKAVFVIVGVEQPQLLAAVHRVERIVDIERDPFGNLGERLAIEIDHRTAHSQQRANVRQFFNREIVDCEQSSRSDGVRSSAILNIGSLRRELASIPSS